MSTQFAQLKEHLSRIREQEAEVLAQLEAQQETAKADLLAAFKEQIEACGFDPEDIAMAIAPKLTRPVKKARAKSTTPRKAPGSKTLYDPQNPANTYTRGPAPAWMKEKMAALGVDPSDKAAVKAFKDTHLAVKGDVAVELPPEQPPALAA